MSSPIVERRRSSSSNPRERFPDLDASHSGERLPEYEEGRDGTARTTSPAKTNGALHGDRWQTRRNNHLAWGDGHLNVVGPRLHGRQRGISDALKNIQIRKASVSENAHEIAEALKAPVSLRILVGELVALKHSPTHRSLRCSALSGT